ncbi:MAG: DUF1924 domain-containing protein [Lysobacter sp.]|nr:DUF1924 domain-containing protein [Lysobacter sp.]
MRILWWSIALCLPFAAQAQSIVQLQAGYAKQAAREDPSFKAFSAARGQRFFLSKHGNEWSCASCHTSDPTRSGKHDVTGRAILPMAPTVNPKRFADAAKTEKWFRRNCRDVVDRECSAQEKGDVLAWLGSLRAGGVR